MYRSHNCGELRISNLEQEVSLSGWVQKVRDKGFFIWIDLRDRYGITQLILDKERSSSPLASGGSSSPNLSSRTCSLKKVACGGRIASMSFAASPTTHLLPTDCHGILKVSCVGLEDVSS